jgi:plasmid stabilization system protein ParE
MRYTLKFRENAVDDYQESVAYYEKISSHFAEKFFLEFKAAIAKIENNPLYFQVRYQNIRIAFLEVFPFGIHFFVEKDSIHVLRILHTKRFF